MLGNSAASGLCDLRPAHAYEHGGNGTSVKGDSRDLLLTEQSEIVDLAKNAILLVYDLETTEVCLKIQILSCIRAECLSDKHDYLSERKWYTPRGGVTDGNSCRSSRRLRLWACHFL